MPLRPRRRPPAPRRRALRALLVLPLLAVAGCGGLTGYEGADHTKPVSCGKSDGKVTLTYWSWIGGMEKAVDLWNRENPDVQVKLKTVPAGNAGTYQNLSNALKAGSAPDLGQVEYDSLANFRLQQGLSDISKCAGVERAKDGFEDWTWSQVTFGEDGRDGVWAVPQDTGPMALYYRKDLFEKYGIDVPRTWEEYYEAAKRLKAESGSYITHVSQSDPNWFTGLLWQNGANMFARSSDQWKVSVDNPAAREVADYWQRMIDEKLVATNLQGFSPALYKAWNNGEVASWVSASWGYSTIRDNAEDTEGKWAVAPMPQWDEGGEPKAGNWGGSTTTVMAGSEHPHEATQFALWLNTDPEALEILNREGGLYPAAKKGLELPALQQPVEFYDDQKVFDVFKEASPQVDTQWEWGPTMTDTYRFMSDGIAGALGDKGTVSDALRAANAKTVDSLERQALDVAK